MKSRSLARSAAILWFVLTAAATAEDLADIRTPRPSPQPRINGPSVFGVRPGSPFLYHIPATGDRPLKFSASGLPRGLKLDPVTGQIAGSLNAAGQHVVLLRARNASGSTEKQFRI